MCSARRGELEADYQRNGRGQNSVRSDGEGGLEVTTRNVGSSVGWWRTVRCRIASYPAFRRRAAGTPWRLVGIVVLLLAFHQMLAPGVASAAERIALVIGNSVYQHVSALPNPGNDAADLGASLRRLGFDVTAVPDAGLAELTRALRQFARRSSGVEVALVFYAGHGMEMDGVNYLVPVDARLERDTDVKFDTVPLDRVLEATRGAALRVVILDACRNNPLAASMQRTDATRSISRGDFAPLNERQLGGEMLVAYAAAEGTVAADGAGRNSPYTAALLAHLEQPLEIGTMFRRVRAQVLTSTAQKQRPHEYQSLLSEHYLAGAPTVMAEPTPPPAVTQGGPDTPTQPIQQREAWQEVVFWESVRESEVAADFEEFLGLWPQGIYAPLAESRLRRLRAAGAETRVVAPAATGTRPGPVSTGGAVPTATGTRPSPASTGRAGPAATGTRPSSVSTGGAVPAASGTRPSSVSTGRAGPAATGTRPSPVSTGGAGPAATGTRPSSVSAGGAVFDGWGGAGSHRHAAEPRFDGWGGAGSQRHAAERPVSTGRAGPAATGTRPSPVSTGGATPAASGTRPSSVSTGGAVPAATGTRPSPALTGGATPAASGTRPSSVSTGGAVPAATGTRPSPVSTGGATPAASGTRPSSVLTGGAVPAAGTRPSPVSTGGAVPAATGTRPSSVSAGGAVPAASGTRPSPTSAADVLDLIEPKGPAGMRFVWVAPGEFRMGSTSSEADDDEAPVTRVRISRGFWLGKYEVTQAEWMAVMGSNPAGFSGCAPCPVERVSWQDVQEFIRRVNAGEEGTPYRLPTEAEWEYAARAGTTEDTYLANLDAVAWHRSISGLRTRSVGQKEPNRFGLHDMLGNVWEWVRDWKGAYPGGAITDPEGPPSASNRVYRGCSWISDAKGCRVSLRYSDAPGYRFNHLGFRLLRVMP